MIRYVRFEHVLKHLWHVVDCRVKHGDRLTAAIERVKHRRDNEAGFTNQCGAWLDKDPKVVVWLEQLSGTV